MCLNSTHIRRPIFGYKCIWLVFVCVFVHCSRKCPTNGTKVDFIQFAVPYHVQVTILWCQKWKSRLSAGWMMYLKSWDSEVICCCFWLQRRLRYWMPQTLHCEYDTWNTVLLNVLIRTCVKFWNVDFFVTPKFSGVYCGCSGFNVRFSGVMRAESDPEMRSALVFQLRALPLQSHGDVGSYFRSSPGFRRGCVLLVL